MGVETAHYLNLNQYICNDTLVIHLLNSYKTFNTKAKQLKSTQPFWDMNNRKKSIFLDWPTVFQLIFMPKWLNASHARPISISFYHQKVWWGGGRKLLLCHNKRKDYCTSTKLCFPAFGISFGVQQLWQGVKGSCGTPCILYRGVQK